MALDVLVLDLAEARGEQVAGRREALDVLVERHEVPLALLEDDAHLLRREQVQILERVEVLRALCVDRRLVPRDRSGAAPRRRRLELRHHLDASAPLDADAARQHKKRTLQRTSRRSWLRFANAAVGGFGIFGSASVLVLSCRLVA